MGKAFLPETYSFLIAIVFMQNYLFSAAKTDSGRAGTDTSHEADDPVLAGVDVLSRLDQERRCKLPDHLPLTVFVGGKWSGFMRRLITFCPLQAPPFVGRASRRNVVGAQRLAREGLRRIVAFY